MRRRNDLMLVFVDEETALSGNGDNEVGTVVVAPVAAAEIGGDPVPESDSVPFRLAEPFARL